MKQCITIYLTGSGIFCGHDDGWRKDAMAMFYKIAKYDDIKICVINPSEFVRKGNIADRQIKSFLFNKISCCDVVLCNLWRTNNDPYVASEVQYAVDHHIPVIGVRGLNACTWIEYSDCDAVFDSLGNAVEYIKDYYMKSMKPIEFIGA